MAASTNRREFLWLSGAAGAGLFGARHRLGSPGTVPGAVRAEGGSGALHALGAHASPGRQTAGPGAGNKLRGVMVDAARQPATIEYYQRVIGFCADWGLNALHFRLTDDQGSALRFETVPGLITHPNALTGEQMRGLVEYGRRRGVELIPEVESFGHTGYITASRRYAGLLDSGPGGLARSGFTGVIPVAPKTLQLFGAIYREVAAIFPSVYFHGGCDEVNWGGSAMSRRALRTKTRVQIWAEYLNSLNRICNALGKELIVWGDYVLHKEPGILGLLHKNIIVMDWQYADTDAITINQFRLKVRANGSRGIGAPALLYSKWGPRAGTQQLRNIEAFADAYLGTEDAGSLGAILTNWVPTRFLQDSIWDGFAYAAVAFTKGPRTARTAGFQHFVEKHYGAEWNAVWSEVFQAIYSDAPPRHGGDGGSGLVLPVPWSTDEELTGVLKTASSTANPFTRLRSRLVLAEPRVRRHLSDFQGFALSVEYLERVFWRQDVVRNEAMKEPLDREAASWLIASIAARDQALADALSRDWDKGRPANAPAKTEPILDFSNAQMLYRWRQAAAYSGYLAAHPGHFCELLAAARPREHWAKSRAAGA